MDTPVIQFGTFSPDAVDEVIALREENAALKELLAVQSVEVQREKDEFFASFSGISAGLQAERNTALSQAGAALGALAEKDAELGAAQLALTTLATELEDARATLSAAHCSHATALERADALASELDEAHRATASAHERALALATKVSALESAPLPKAVSSPPNRKELMRLERENKELRSKVEAADEMTDAIYKKLNCSELGAEVMKADLVRLTALTVTFAEHVLESFDCEVVTVAIRTFLDVEMAKLNMALKHGDPAFLNCAKHFLQQHKTGRLNDVILGAGSDAMSEMPTGVFAAARAFIKVNKGQ